MGIGRADMGKWALEKRWKTGRKSKQCGYWLRPVHPKGNPSWIFTGRTDAEAETPIRWPPDTKSGLI